MTSISQLQKSLADQKDIPQNATYKRRQFVLSVDEFTGRDCKYYLVGYKGNPGKDGIGAWYGSAVRIEADNNGLVNIQSAIESLKEQLEKLQQ